MTGLQASTAARLTHSWASERSPALLGVRRGQGGEPYCDNNDEVSMGTEATQNKSFFDS